MNNCKEQPINFVSNGFHFDNVCNIYQDTNNNQYITTQYYYNLNKVRFCRNDSTNSGGYEVYVCKYNLDKTFVSKTNAAIGLGLQSKPDECVDFELNENYLYRFSLNRFRFTNDAIGYKCNSNINSMSNELAFGSGSSLFTNLGDLAPLFIVVIGFALGFYFLKNIVRKGQKGKTL